MTRTSNDQKSDANNPTSREFKDNQDNRRDQLNPDHEAYEKSRTGNQQQEQQKNP